jgi:hypothetical protein
MNIGFFHVKRLFKSACLELEDNSNMLSRLDLPGCGDTLGLSTGKVALIMEKALDEWKEGTSIKGFLEDMGMKVMEACDDDGNLLWGSMFTGFSKGLNSNISIDEEHFKKMFVSSLEEVRRVTDSRVKDRSFLDALAHTVGAIEASKLDIPDMLEEAAAEARGFKENGRLNRNAAAVSIHLFFEGMAKGLYSYRLEHKSLQFLLQAFINPYVIGLLILSPKLLHSF